ncbi:NAD/NADP-dependent betaine aldehyde dehydrogenase [Ruegeria meonggei]|uniref:NAD/NADP-dependent betaine aldehyde dehydrogenase n=1 Tax=Ruegeria meonggei TaxID=1446476 RepID=A0A1X6Z1T7_9RHOB|nr:NAD/NADP-dependent betaine aldehyde dehydrogenase [Ruegeria meonggei]
MLEKAEAIRFGDPQDPGTQLGCVIYDQGAEILFHPGRQGALLPIVIDKVPQNSVLVMEEPFGPIVRVPDNDPEVMANSNSTDFGLASGNNDLNRANASINGLDVDTCNIWEQPGYRIEMSPFTGLKDSGNGVKEGVIKAMKFFKNAKT